MNNLTPGEQFLIRRKLVKRPYQPSTAFMVIVILALLLATILQFKDLPTPWNVKTPQVSLIDKTTNKDMCRELMAGKYEATVEVYKYCTTHGIR